MLLLPRSLSQLKLLGKWSRKLQNKCIGQLLNKILGHLVGKLFPPTGTPKPKYKFKSETERPDPESWLVMNKGSPTGQTTPN